MDCLYLDEVERKHHWNGTEMEPSGEKKTGKTKAVTKTDCFERFGPGGLWDEVEHVANNRVR